MLKQFLFIKCVLVLFSCNTVNEDIITMLGSKQKFKQVTKRVYGNENGFCSSALFLNSDSTFLYERGCEGRSHITIGSWKVINDSIELIALENTKLSLIANVEFSKENRNQQTKFLISDKTGVPVSDFIFLPIDNKGQYRVTTIPSIVLDANGNRIYCPKTNVNGVISIEKSEFDTLIFPELEVIAKRRFRIPSKDLPDTIKIDLDINYYGFAYPELTYIYWNEPVRFKIDGNKLVNFDHELKQVR